MKITVNENKKIISAKGHTDMLNKSTKYGNITIPKKSVYVTAKCSEEDRWNCYYFFKKSHRTSRNFTINISINT